MLIHTIVKINLVREGYLHNHPYHLISDEEMIDAFLKVTRDKNNQIDSIEGYFPDMYSGADLPQSLQPAYIDLVENIMYHLDSYKNSEDKSYVIPDWVYSYMIGSCIVQNSPTEDKHDLFVLLNLDNIDDEFTDDIYTSCYNISKEWIKKLPPSKNNHRPPTMFGEPHVIKSLRLLKVDVLS